MLAVSLMLAAAACGRGERQDTGAADSLSRDLRLAPADTTNALNDRPGAADTAVATTPPPAAAPATPSRTNTATRTPARTTPRTPARTSTTPSTSSSGGAATATGASLAAGTQFTATTDAEIRSNKNKVGDVITATVANDVKDRNGRTVIPAGSKVNLKVTAIHESENKSDTTGTLTIDVASISLNGRDVPVAAHPSVKSALAGRSTGVGDVAKVGAGAGVGAVVGRVLGGSTKGAVIGGIIGGAVGAQRAVETKDRDVVVPAGSSVTIVLDETFRPTT
ncbi:MAG TPA: hypothetical protein VFS40_04870 [Gemmatimonadales bacterium]|nr:hypothetical protein [Gemmatimonadales bacterium]